MQVCHEIEDRMDKGVESDEDAEESEENDEDVHVAELKPRRKKCFLVGKEDAVRLAKIRDAPKADFGDATSRVIDCLFAPRYPIASLLSTVAFAMVALLAYRNRSQNDFYVLCILGGFVSMCIWVGYHSVYTRTITNVGDMLFFLGASDVDHNTATVREFHNDGMVQRRIQERRHQEVQRQMQLNAILQEQQNKREHDKTRKMIAEQQEQRRTPESSDGVDSVFKGLNRASKNYERAQENTADAYTNAAITGIRLYGMYNS